MTVQIDIETPSREEMRKQLRSVERLIAGFVGALLSSALVYALGVVGTLAMNPVGTFAYVFGALSAAVAAGLVTGGSLGFIFGIPKLLRSTAEARGDARQASGAAVPDAPAPQGFVVNTNLEEISDWLTKIIVGLTLVESGALVDGAGRLARWFKEGVPTPGADMMSLLLAVAAVAAGFLFFYVETRTRITLLLVDADAVAGPGRVAAADITKAVMDAPVGPAKPLATPSGGRDRTLAGKDAELLRLPIERLNKPDEFAAWGAAQARAGRTQAAIRALREAVGRAPGDATYLVLLGDTMMWIEGGAQAAVDAYKEARGLAGDRPDLLRKELLAALYAPAPKGFQDALATAATLLAKDPGARDDAFVNLWIAAARGQQFEWLTRNAGSAGEWAAARDEALEAVRAVVRLQPDAGSPVRRILREIYDPAAMGSSPSNNDLEVFKDDPDFRDLITG